jgi:hypothetical protein
MPIVNRSSASFRTVILLLAFIKNSGVCIYWTPMWTWNHQRCWMQNNWKRKRNKEIL